MLSSEVAAAYREATEAQAFHEDRAAEFAAQRANAVGRMRHAFHMSREDIAKELGLKLHTVNELLARARP